MNVYHDLKTGLLAGEKCEVIDLNKQGLTGDLTSIIEEMIEKTPNLQILNLSYNHFHGSIPETINSLKKLRELNLSYNRIDGNVPKTIKELSQLEVLNLSRNQLNGVFPSVEHLTFLKELYLNGNQFEAINISKEFSLKLDVFEMHDACIQKQKYFAEVIEVIEHKNSDAWNCLKVGVFENYLRIGEYIRNYHRLNSTFFPFKHKNGKWLALYSPEYTATRIMELPSCKDIGGEECDENGFCPVEFYVPNYYDWKTEDGEMFRLNQLTLKEFEKDFKNENIEDLQYWPFGFVAGCVWGDDISWKIQYLDLSRADEGILTRSEKFGYIWLPGNISLAEAIDFIDFDGEKDFSIQISLPIRFDLSKDYHDVELWGSGEKLKKKIS